MKGVCENPECQRPIEWTHKSRKYCDRPACRKRMSRERKAQKERERYQEEREQLFTRWRGLHLHPRVVEILETLLAEKNGLSVARMATDALEVQYRIICEKDEKRQ